MNVTGQVGAPAASFPPGATTALIRQGNMADVITSQLHGRWYEAAYRGALFGAANTAAVATTAALATTYTGLVLYNPNGSKVNLSLQKVGIAAVVAQTSALSVGLMVGSSTTAFSGVTAVASHSKFLGSGISAVGQVASAATLPATPVLDQVLGYIGTGAVTVDQFLQGLVPLDGDLLIAPGGFVAMYTSAASVAASLLFSAQWEEIPV